jgi:hypothetical protein
MMLHVSGVNRYRETAGWKLHRLDAAGMSIELPGDPVSSDRPVISIMLEEQVFLTFTRETRIAKDGFGSLRS